MHFPFALNLRRKVQVAEYKLLQQSIVSSQKEFENEKEFEMCARKAAHLSNLALQFFDCVELPLPAVLSSHFVLPTASDVAAELHLENRSLSSLGLAAALCSQEKYFVLKKRLCSRGKALCSQEKHFVLMKKHFVLRKYHLF